MEYEYSTISKRAQKVVCLLVIIINTSFVYYVTMSVMFKYHNLLFLNTVYWSQ